jgi:2'-5' RNA ligase
MRLFVAIPLASGIVDELASLCARLRPQAGELRWSTPETWHITLVFLGESTMEQYRCIAAGLGQLQCPALPIHLEEPGIFERAGVFHVGIGLNPTLLSLQQGVQTAAQTCGFRVEARRYQPHITLARTRNPLSLRKLQALPQIRPAFSSFVAHEFRIYESFLGPAGARHEIRDRFPLGGQA